MLDFVQNIISDLNIGPTATQVGLVIYSNNARIEFLLNRYNNANDMTTRIMTPTQQGTLGSYIGGTTNTAEGIQYARTQVFSTGNGARSSAAKLMIVLTDGESNVNPDQTIPEANAARAAGIEIMVVGVTDSINLDEIRGISSDPRNENENWWRSPDFNQLSQIELQITSTVCSTGAVATDNLYCRPTCCYGTICHCVTDTAQGVYPVNGTSCTDNNECNEDNGLCEDQCINTDGSYYCTCPSGYELGQNNRECEDQNECNNPNTCASGYVCVNTWGSYHCLQGAFAAASIGMDPTLGVGTVAATTSSTTNLVGIVVALALALVNVAVLGLLAARFVRRRRAQEPAAAPSGAFRAEAGTVRSFNSLVSKFGSAVDVDSISTVSSISS